MTAGVLKGCGAYTWNCFTLEYKQYFFETLLTTRPTIKHHTPQVMNPQ